MTKKHVLSTIAKAGDFADVESIGTHTMRKPSAIGSINKQKMLLCYKKFLTIAHHTSPWNILELIKKKKIIFLIHFKFNLLKITISIIIKRPFILK